IDGATNTVVATVAVGQYPKVVLAYAPANLVFVHNGIDRTMTIIDGRTNAVVRTVSSPSIDSWMQLGMSKYVYAVDGKAQLVRVLDLTKLKVIASIPVSQPSYMAVNASAKLVYVTTNENSITVIDTTTNMVTGTFKAGGLIGPLGADPVNNLL